MNSRQLFLALSVLLLACDKDPPPPPAEDPRYHAQLAEETAAGYVILDAQGAVTELALTIAGDPELGLTGVIFDRSAEASSILAGAELSASFGVLASNRALRALAPPAERQGEDYWPAVQVPCRATIAGTVAANRTAIDASLNIACTGIAAIELPLAFNAFFGGNEECPPNRKCTARTVCIQPIQIARDNGDQPTSCPGFDAASELFERCCMSLDVRPPRTINRLAFKNLRVEDNGLSAQENELFGTDNDDASSAGCIEVYCPETLSLGTVFGKNVHGGGHTFFGGGADAKVTIVEGAAEEVLAHELGHALGLPHLNGTFMEPTGAHDVAAPQLSSEGQCRGTFASPNARLELPAHDCCLEHDLP